MPIFTIKNAKKLFTPLPVLTVQECLELLPNLSQYSYDDYQEGFNRSAFLADTLVNAGGLWLGIPGKSDSGHRLHYDQKEQAYKVYVDYFALPADLELALAYIKRLSQHLKKPIITDDGQKFSSENIKDFPYTPILEGNLIGLCQADRQEEQVLYYLKRSLVIGRKMAERLIYMGKPILSTYEEVILAAQYPEAHIHEQTFHLTNDQQTIYGNYSIGEELAVVLPRRPFVERHNETYLVGHPLSHWTLSIVYKSEDRSDWDYRLVGTFPYQDVMDRLLEYPYEELDDNFIITSSLSRENLQAIIDQLTATS
ncbi:MULTISPECIES: DUF4299 family protein [unclassified Streptococcus]|uniref:DUF4299 family protein n=1 Tax=unclassified Streptococcus TaxID=2608887 RepID=UPI00359E41B0